MDRRIVCNAVLMILASSDRDHYRPR